MALIKELNSSYGVNPSYHRVVCVSINLVTKETTICVGSYVSKEKRLNGFEPLDTLDIYVPIEDFYLFLDENIVSAAYKWLRENIEGFEDAIDD